jgi:hypothetical protein
MRMERRGVQKGQREIVHLILAEASDGVWGPLEFADWLNQRLWKLEREMPRLRLWRHFGQEHGQARADSQPHWSTFASCHKATEPRDHHPLAGLVVVYDETAVVPLLLQALSLLSHEKVQEEKKS